MSDILDIEKINNLPQPLLARMVGGGEWPIETICVQTGLIRLDVHGMIDRSEFSMIREIVDEGGIVHDPDDFYIEESKDD